MNAPALPVADARSARQAEGIQKWIASKASSTFEWATGMGKSHTAITLIKRVQAQHPLAQTHIVVPTLFLQDQFRRAVTAAGLARVDVYVINTYVKQPRTCQLLIADEVHLFLGEHAQQFPRLFTTSCVHTWFLGLSATLTPEEQQRLVALGCPVVDVITLAEAQAHGWVSACKTYNLGVALTPPEQAEYQRWQDIFSSTFARFSHDFGLAMACIGNRSAREDYAHQMGWREELGPKDRWSPQTLGAAANQWLQATQNRQRVVNQASAKLSAAAYLCRKFPVKAICFSESTAFASALAAQMPDICRAYHSQVASTTEEYTLTKTFKTKPHETVTKTRRVSGTALCRRAVVEFNDAGALVRVLSTARALDQGADFAGLRLGIETSGNSSVRQKVQRTGRVVRQEKGLTEKLAVYVHIYALGSYEQNKLRRKQKGMSGILEITDLNHITF